MKRYISHYVMLVALVINSSASSQKFLGETTKRDYKSRQPYFPMKFVATLQITSDLLHPDTTYPPRIRIIELLYDYPNKRGIATIKKGYEEGKTYIRRYDKKYEYMIKRGKYSKCLRSYMGEEMPIPTLPELISLAEDTIISDDEEQVVEHWVHNIDGGTERVHIYFNTNGTIPIRLVHEEVDFDSGMSTKLMTYDFVKFETRDIDGSLNETMFELPEPNTHQSCEFHVGGFPYLFLFHHYARL